MCVKKDDLKSGHCEVHKGDDTWEPQLDTNVFPELATNVANSLQEFLTNKKPLVKNNFDKLIQHLDYMAEKGYINTDDKDLEKEMLRQYNTFTKDLRLVINAISKKNKLDARSKRQVV